MNLEVLCFIMVLWSPGVSLRHSVNMCNWTGRSAQIVLYQDASTSSEDTVCSCNLSSTGDFYLQLKRFHNSGECNQPILIGSPAGNTTIVDLEKMYSDLEGSDCVLHVGNMSRELIPRNCSKSIANNGTNKVITLEVLNSLRNDSHIYLRVMVNGNIRVNCTRKALSDSLMYEILNNRSESNESGDTSCVKTSLIGGISQVQERGKMTTVITENTMIGEREQQSRRMMTVTMILLPFAGLAFLGSFIILLAAYRARKTQRIESKRRRGLTRRTTTKDAPSYYEEVDEEFHIQLSSISAVTNTDTIYEYATREDELTKKSPSSTYDIARMTPADKGRGLTLLQTPDNNEDIYNVASYSPGKGDRTPDIDNTYDVAQKFPVLAADSTNGSVGIDENDGQSITDSKDFDPAVNCDPLQLTQVPATSTRQTTNEYSLQKFASNDKESTDDDLSTVDIVVINNDREEITDKDENSPLSSTNPLENFEDEVYQNFSSLQSESAYSIEESVEDQTKEAEDEDHVNTNEDTEIKENTSDTNRIEAKNLQVPKSTKAGYVNVAPPEPKPAETCELIEAADLEEDIYENTLVAGSTVSLISSNSEKDTYENCAAKKDDKEENSTTGVEDQSQKNKGINVVVLSPPAGNDDKKKPRHKPSISLDESTSHRQRKNSKRRRPRSDDTFLLNTSDSEEDVMAVVNTHIYEGIDDAASPKKRVCNENAVAPDSDLPLILTRDDEDEDDDFSIMVNNDLYESFFCGGVCILPDNVSDEMKKKLKEKAKNSPINESSPNLSEKM